MADEVSSSDVLCDAVEYLYKLGRNLKSRSESLKQRRGNKSKLRNTHEIRKVASKLLLICEHSKKSLENIEMGIKTMINIVNSSSSISQVDSSNTDIQNNEQYQYFKLGSTELKVSKSVPMKHYLSAKVLATPMHSSVQDKFPVYNDCKLYRFRNKNKTNSEFNSIEINKTSNEDCIGHQIDENIIKPVDSDESFNNEYKHVCSEDLNNHSLSNSKSDNKTELRSTALISNTEFQESLNNHQKINNETGNEDKITLISEQKNRMSDTDCVNVLQDQEIISEVNEFQENLTSDNSKCQQNKETNLTSKIIEVNKNEDFENKRILITPPIPLEENDVIETNKLSKEKAYSPSESCVISNKSVKQKEDKSENKTDETDVVNINIENPVEVNELTTNGNNSGTDSSASSKPLLKCVSLHKLLKPALLKEKKNNLDKNKVCSKKIIMKKKNITTEYWSQKRKEVKAFKSKKFDISITRLPELSIDFLKNYNLKRITQNGVTLVSTMSEIDSYKCIKPVITKAKESLLDDSASDNNGSELDESKKLDKVSNNATNKKIKENINDNLQNVETLKKSLLSLTDDENNDGKTQVQKDSTLPSDTNCKDIKNDSPEKEIFKKTHQTPKKNKDKNKVATPQSKRKRIMESMFAKKMLLTYSSSSDSEDELVKHAMKQIQKDLMKSSSSSEDEIDLQSRKNKILKESPRKISVKSKKALFNSSSDHSNTKKKLKQAAKVNESSSQENKPKTPSKINKSSKESSSSCQDSDKDIKGLVNMKNLIKVRRRHKRSRTPDAPLRRNPCRNPLPTAPAIKTDDLLKSASESDSSNVKNGSEERGDSPLLPIPGLASTGIENIAKDDLLEDSNSSGSEDSTEENKKSEDSEDIKTTKSKSRRKMAMLSDSDAEKKDKTVKGSDFADSDVVSSEPAKKKSRRKLISNSDDSSLSDDSKKKRKRIKRNSDSDGSESENEKNKSGRKNIRKVMGKNKLEDTTKKAAREEKDRRARIAERQKMYNNVDFDETGKPDEVSLDKVVLDFDPETKEPVIEVDRGLVQKLKPHQANGIKFMWNACFESVNQIKMSKGSGCILAHCMGLGKTLQVISLIHTLMKHRKLTKIKRVLVVCPLSTVLNWVSEFRKWLRFAEKDVDIDVYELSRFKINAERSHQLKNWLEDGGVCVLGYEMFRNLSADNPKKYKKSILKNFQDSLVDPGPDLVVCDEGHLLKNEKTSLSQSMNRIKTLRRIVLTGTPLQNNLKEYYCMVQFVKPNLLGKYNEYLNRFVNPITNGQYTNSTEHDIRVMKRRSHVLHNMLDGAVQRRDYGVLSPFLPAKHEYVLFTTLNEVQAKLYQHYLDNCCRRQLGGKVSLFTDYQSLQRVWTHPLVLKYSSERYEIAQQKKRDQESSEDTEGSLGDFLDDSGKSTTEDSSSDSSDDSSDNSNASKKKSKKSEQKLKPKTSRGTRSKPVEEIKETEKDENVEEISEKIENPTEWWMKLLSNDELEDMRNSPKLLLLFEILKQCEAIGDKLLVFSQSLYSLDLIEHFLSKVDEATQRGDIDDKLGGYTGSWSLGLDYFRLDGSTSCENRAIGCKHFNKESNPRARLFLISTRAGGLGINLVAANRVVIFDVSWNPSHDVQSIFRIYRFGQKKPCYIYRFLAMGTMEEKIYERQVTKQSISKRVIDEQQIDRHYAEHDLAELYQFQAKPPMPRPLPPLPKDRLFAELLQLYEELIYKYHEHDSLLENKEEETLDEEERKAAWEDFENEKIAPPPIQLPTMLQNGLTGTVPNMPMMMGNQFGPAYQQQLAMTSIAAMLMKEMPNIDENQLKNMVPLIYKSNPGIMQSLQRTGFINPLNRMPLMKNSDPNINIVRMNLAQSQNQNMRYPTQSRTGFINPNRFPMTNKPDSNINTVRMNVASSQNQNLRHATQSKPGQKNNYLPKRGRPPHRPLQPTTSGDVVNIDSD